MIPRITTKTRAGLILFVIIISGCNLSQENIPATSSTTNTPPTVDLTINIDPTTPSVLELKIILITSNNSDAKLVDETTLMLNNFAQQSGMVVEIQDESNFNRPSSEVKIVVVIEPQKDYSDLVRTNLDVQFIFLNGNNTPPLANLQILSPSGNAEISKGFLAGYMAAIQTEEWRVGIINYTNEEGLDQKKGFLNGVKYFCGLCLPQFPPYYDYPLFAEIPVDSSLSEWKQTADLLLNKAVDTIYVSGQNILEAQFQYLADSGVNIIAEVAPPDSVRPNWISSLGYDVLENLEAALLKIHENERLDQVESPLKLTNVNDENLSSARQIHLEEIIDLLANGIIDPAGEQ